MQPFRTPTDEFTSSIALDASTVGNTTVTVGVYAARQEEFEILEGFYEHSTDLDFWPFLHKANELDYHDDADFYEAVIADNQSRLTAFSHTHEGNSQSHQVEAVHSSIIVHDHFASGDRPLVLIDGAERNAEPFTRAVCGLRQKPPDTVHCIQAERYYPTALLADVTAYYLAHQFDNGDYDYTRPLLRVPNAKQTRSDEWGQAYSALYNGQEEYEPAQIPAMQAGTVPGRIRCWYDGAVASGSTETPDTESLNPIVQHARRHGYERAATVLSEI